MMIKALLNSHDQLTITIKSKFIISKFIKKIVFKTIIKPLLRYINSNYQDMLTAQIPKISPPKPINQNNDITTNLTQDIISALNSQKNKIDIVEFNIKGQKLILYPQIAQNSISQRENKHHKIHSRKLN